MSVEFDEGKNFNSLYEKSVYSNQTGLTAWLLKKNILRDEKSAKSVLVIFTIIFFGLSAIILFI